MPKGGAREPSSTFAVAKGMSVEDHYNALEFASFNNKIKNTELLDYLNTKFGRFGTDSATETARSWVKELVRYGMVNPVDKDCNEIEVTAESWSSGEMDLFQITDYGRVCLANHQLFPYEMARSAILAMDNGIFPQCHDMINSVFEYEGILPISNPEGRHGQSGVIIDSYKAISKTLESTGLVFATLQGYRLNHNFIDSLRNNEINELFSDVGTRINDENISIQIVEEGTIITSFKREQHVIFKIKIRNKSKNEISLKLEDNLSPILENISCISYDKDIELKQKEEKVISFDLESTYPCLPRKTELPGSCDWPFFIGTLVARTKDFEKKMFLPTIKISLTDKVWEKKCCQLLEKLGLQVFPQSNSDRPDAVVDISELTSRPKDITEYLQGDAEKLLMETTMNEYGGSKLKQDVENFEPHTTLNVKIGAVGQIIVADYFSPNIQTALADVQEENNHIITLIDKDNLEYLILKHKQDSDYSKVVSVLKSNQLVDKKLIDSIF
jgi:hypothetical protein